MVNEYIQRNQNDDEANFEGNWLLIAHWDHVHPSPHGEEDQRGYSDEQLSQVCSVISCTLNFWIEILLTNNSTLSK